jgi:Na+/proline symporter
MNIKSFLWRVIYAVIFVVVLTFVIPLLFQVVGFSMPSGPAVQLILFCFAVLVILYVLFGPEPPALF